MKILFYASDKPRERLLAEAMRQGMAAFGDTVETVIFGDPPTSPDQGLRYLPRYEGPEPETDVAVMVGVKGNSRQICEDHWKQGAHTLYLDKGYIRDKTSGLVRGWEYWKCGVDGFQPLRYFQCGRPSDRWERIDKPLLPKRGERGRRILFAQSTQKYYDWHGLGNCEDYARRVMREIRKRFKVKHAHIVYRPKPTRKEMGALANYGFSPHAESITAALMDCRALVTFGSNAAVDAIMAGVPAIVLGDGIARPVSGTEIDDLVDPPFPTDEERWQWLCDMAYCQWTSDEMRSGEAWEHLRPVVLS